MFCFFLFFFSFFFFSSRILLCCIISLIFFVGSVEGRADAALVQKEVALDATEKGSLETCSSGSRLHGAHATLKGYIRGIWSLASGAGKVEAGTPVVARAPEAYFFSSCHVVNVDADEELSERRRNLAAERWI